jgi:hypothetical protein
MIAVQADGPPVDFSCLEQPTLDRSRGAGEPLDSPLGRLLKNALYASGGTRGMDRADVDKSALRLISMQTLPRR